MKQLVTFGLIWLLSTTAIAQSTSFYLVLKSSDKQYQSYDRPRSWTNNDSLNLLFNKYQTTHYIQSFPYAKNPELKNVYTITLNGDPSLFKQEITTTKGHIYSKIIRVENNNPTPLYNPSDIMWYTNETDGSPTLWHLKKVQADLAWDITKSNSTVRAAIIDTGFDNTHPDLVGKFYPEFDPVTLQALGPAMANGVPHGTFMSSILAAKTDGGGLLASIGFNTSMLGYEFSNGLSKALHASTVMNADVLSISFFSYCQNGANSVDSLIIKEILDNGTTIVASAGNNPSHCGGGRLFPFSAYYDERVIVVSSTNKNDYHNNGTAVHSHYSDVDICAPGFDIIGAMSSTYSPYSWTSGTSPAVPIVAGTVALMKSVNPCLTPSQIQSIIKETADPIADASSYPGLVGAGRINAYKAVQKAQITSGLGGWEQLNATAQIFNNQVIPDARNPSYYNSISISGTSSMFNTGLTILKAKDFILFSPNTELSPLTGSCFNAIIQNCGNNPNLRYSNFLLNEENSQAQSSINDFLSKVYPNPSTGTLTLDLSKVNSYGNVKVTIKNNLNETVFESISLENKIHAINLNKLPNGIYYILISSDTKNEFHKIILEK